MMIHNKFVQKLLKFGRGEPKINYRVLHVVQALVYGYEVRRGTTTGAIISHHSTLQQAVHYAKSKALSERGGVVVWGPVGPPTTYDYERMST